jgi:hypothetical protein
MPPNDLCAGDGSATVIAAGASQTFSGALTRGCVSVYGTLTLAEGTQLTVRTLHTHAGSRLRAVGQNITIQTADVPPTDGDQFHTGLILEGAVEIQGVGKTSWTRLTAEMPAGATTIQVANANGWAVGDTVVIPDSRDINAPQYQGQSRGPETFAITGINGQAVTLDRPAQYEHPGARNANGQLAGVFPPVGNLTRSITIRSQNPNGVRGHLMITHGATGYIRNVDIRDFGRTTNDPLSGSNHIGRYAAHIHMASTPGFELSGSSVRDYLKWGLTVHGTNGQNVLDNVVYNGWGAGIMTEDGTERDNRIERNLVVRVRGTGGRGDERAGANEFGVNGACVWLQGPFNLVRDNVAANCQSYGHTIWGGPGRYSGCITEFSGNEAFGMFTGFSPWYVGSPSCTSIVDRLRTWHVFEGRFGYPSINITYRDHWHRGDPRVQQENYWSSGAHFGDYDSPGARDVRPDIQNARFAVGPPFGVADWREEGAERFYELVDGRFDGNHTNVGFHTPSGSYPPEWQKPHIAVIRNTSHGSVRANGKKIARTFEAKPDSNLIQVQRVIVEGHDGVAGQDFELFMAEQAPSFVIPGTGYAAGTNGLTNASAWSSRGVAIAGAVAPCSTTRSDVMGLVCPSTGSAGIPSAPPPSSSPAPPPSSSPTPPPSSSPAPSLPPLSAPTNLRIIP